MATGKEYGRLVYATQVGLVSRSTRIENLLSSRGVLMRELSAQALRTAVVKAASEDGAFRNDLINQGGAAVTARFGEQPLHVRVHVEGENELAVLVPHKTEQLARSVEHVATNLADRPPTRSEFEALLIHRVWNDPVFLAQLRKGPRGAINTALEKYKASVPEEANVVVYEEQPGECLILVPRAPTDASELSEAELATAAGGLTVLTSSSMAGNLASKIVDIIYKPPTK
jgi:hypothetical protein